MNTNNEPMRLLLIENNPEDIKEMQEAITAFNISYKLDVMSKSYEALQYLKKEGKYENALIPDLILMNWQLSTLSAPDLLKKIKDDTYLKNIPVLVMSNLEEREVIRAYNGYVTACLLKPKNREELIVMIKIIEEFWFKIVKLPSRAGNYND